MYSSQGSAIYDIIISHRKNYAEEAEKLHELIQQYKRSSGNTLLDVACGTGLHLITLNNWYAAEGTDLNEDMLSLARKRHPDIVFTQSDMTELNLQKQFDVIVCLFSAISYTKTLDRMRQAVAMMARHLKAGGVLILEPWIRKENYRPGTVYAEFINRPEIKIAQMIRIQREEDLCISDVHYMVGRASGIEEFTEKHEIGLFYGSEFMAALEDAGLEATYDEEGLMGMALYIGVRGEALPDENILTP